MPTYISTYLSTMQKSLSPILITNRRIERITDLHVWFNIMENTFFMQFWIEVEHLFIITSLQTTIYNFTDKFIKLSSLICPNIELNVNQLYILVQFVIFI